MKLTVEKIRSLCTDESFRRGVEYFREGRVHNVRLSSGKVTSVVEGNRIYRVSVKLLRQATDASCTAGRPSEYFDAYKRLIIPFVDSRTGRDHYRDVVRQLRQMKKINWFESEFKELTRFIKEKHARKPAFEDELKKL